MAHVQLQGSCEHARMLLAYVTYIKHYAVRFGLTSGSVLRSRGLQR
jgi:hypothetical protein